MSIDRPEIRSFQPPVRTLMGPGPSDVPPRVLSALARPTVGHLDPAFVGMMDELKTLLRYAFQTRNELTFPVSGPGSLGMETCFVNLVTPGDKVIVCVNGVFGGRMAENVRRLGGVAVIVEDAWGAPVDPAKVEAAFAANPDAALLAFVHAETSTGALSDAAALAAIARRHRLPRSEGRPALETPLRPAIRLPPVFMAGFEPRPWWRRLNDHRGWRALDDDRRRGVAPLDDHRPRAGIAVGRIRRRIRGRIRCRVGLRVAGGWQRVGAGIDRRDHAPGKGCAGQQGGKQVLHDSLRSGCSPFNARDAVWSEKKSLEMLPTPLSSM